MKDLKTLKKTTNFKTKKASSKIKNSKQRTRRDIKNYNLLNSMNRNFEGNLNVTFKMVDGSKKTMPLQDSFFKNEKNRTLSEAKILTKLNTIKHDFVADEYIINKLQ